MKEIIVNVDAYNENSIRTVEGDNLSEVYKIYICKNKRRINLTNKIAIMAYVNEYGNKKSNILALNITNANQGEIELPITNVISSENGIYACQVAIYGENNSLEQTAPFSLIVENNIFSKISNTAINSTDFHILSEAIKTTSEYAEKLKQGTENIELQYANKLNEKMNKDDVLSMTNMGQDVKEAMTGGSVAVVGRDAVDTINLRDKSIEYSKLSQTLISGIPIYHLKNDSGKGFESSFALQLTYILDNPKSLSKIKSEFNIRSLSSNVNTVCTKIAYNEETSNLYVSEPISIIPNVNTKINGDYTGSFDSVSKIYLYVWVTMKDSNISTEYLVKNIKVEIDDEYLGEPYECAIYQKNAHSSPSLETYMGDKIINNDSLVEALKPINKNLINVSKSVNKMLSPSSKYMKVKCKNNKANNLAQIEIIFDLSKFKTLNPYNPNIKFKYDVEKFKNLSQVGCRCFLNNNLVLGEYAGIATPVFIKNTPLNGECLFTIFPRNILINENQYALHCFIELKALDDLNPVETDIKNISILIDDEEVPFDYKECSIYKKVDEEDTVIFEYLDNSFSSFKALIDINTTDIIKVSKDFYTFRDDKKLTLIQCKANKSNKLIQIEYVFDLTSFSNSVNAVLEYKFSSTEGIKSYGDRLFLSDSAVAGVWGNFVQYEINKIPYDANRPYSITFNETLTDKKYIHWFVEFEPQDLEKEYSFYYEYVKCKIDKKELVPIGHTFYNPNPTDIIQEVFSPECVGFRLEKMKEEILKELAINPPSKLQGKSWNVMGDSISRGHSLQVSQTYNGVIAKKNSMDLQNYAVNGKRLTGSTGNAYGASMVVDYVNMRDNVDYVSIFGGTNDRGIPLGTPDSKDIETIYGTLNVLCDGILNKYPTSKVFFITPMKCDNTPKTEQIVNAIKEVCGKFSIPVLDLYHEGTLCPMQDAQFKNLMLPNDRLHPNIEGHKRLASRIQSFMEQL